jgi:hypothetical protein
LTGLRERVRRTARRFVLRLLLRVAIVLPLFVLVTVTSDLTGFAVILRTRAMWPSFSLLLYGQTIAAAKQLDIRPQTYNYFSAKYLILDIANLY